MSKTSYFRVQHGKIVVLDYTNISPDGNILVQPEALEAFIRDCGGRRLPAVNRKEWTLDERIPRVYIAGPVTGTDDYEERFAKAEKEYTDTGWDVVNPVKIIKLLPEMSHDECMAVCRTLLSLCDAAHFLINFEWSQGALEEYKLAKDLGLTIFEEEIIKHPEPEGSYTG